MTRYRFQRLRFTHDCSVQRLRFTHEGSCNCEWQIRNRLHDREEFRGRRAEKYPSETNQMKEDQYGESLSERSKSLRQLQVDRKEAVKHEQQPVVDTPDDEEDAGAMPQTA